VYCCFGVFLSSARSAGDASSMTASQQRIRRMTRFSGKRNVRPNERVAVPLIFALDSAGVQYEGNDVTEFLRKQMCPDNHLSAGSRRRRVEEKSNGGGIYRVGEGALEEFAGFGTAAAEPELVAVKEREGRLVRISLDGLAQLL